MEAMESAERREGCMHSREAAEWPGSWQRSEWRDARRCDRPRGSIAEDMKLDRRDQRSCSPSPSRQRRRSRSTRGTVGDSGVSSGAGSFSGIHSIGKGGRGRRERGSSERESGKGHARTVDGDGMVDVGASRVSAVHELMSIVMEPRSQQERYFAGILRRAFPGAVLSRYLEWLREVPVLGTTPGLV